MKRNNPTPMRLLWLLLALLWLAAPLQADDSTDYHVIHQERSLYRNIFVFEKGNVRCLGFGLRQDLDGCQSCIYLDDPNRMFYDYTKVMLASLYLNPNPKNILVIGLGGGVIPKALAALLPEAKIDLVEIDPAVHRVAEAYFEFPADERLAVHEMDGRVFVKRAGKRKAQYDLILLDAFNGDYIPEHLLTKEFLEEVKLLLAEKGVLSANTFSASKLYHSESATYEKVFGEFYNVKLANRLIFWRRNGLPELAEMIETARTFDGRLDIYGVEKGFVLSHMSKKKDWKTDAPVLTDQYSPSNLMKAM